MRYVEHRPGGAPDVLRVARMPRAAPADDEVLIQVLAAGVNRPDIEQRKGAYPPPPDANPLLGLEVAGLVTEVGSAVRGLSVGDRVCALTNGGGYAEFCVAPAGQCLPWPDGFGAEEAAALPENYFTVWANLFHLGQLQRGETVLVHGGTSGIGLAAIQLGREFGARVIATAGSPAKLQACRDAGAEYAIDYTRDDFVQAVQQHTQQRGVDVVLDIVGGPYFARNLDCLGLGGRLVMLGFMGGYMAESFDIRPIFKRRLTVAGSVMRPRTAAEKAAIATELRNRVWPLLSAGRCRPRIQQVFALEEVSDAHRAMEKSQHIGKIVLKL
jgi:NADPH2:quinone reductase